MINDLLDISRVEAGLMRYNFQHSNIHDIIHKSIDDIRFLAETKNINIHSAKKNPIPEILLDRAKIAQVLDNILSNAIKFTPNNGAITITVKEAESTPVLPILAKQNRLNDVHSFIQVSISDTGIGIPIEYHTKIFDKFQQINSRGKGAIKGTGLGLFIAKHIVLDHGGDIWVENNTMGNGTTFHFTLPAKYEYALNFETRF
jgi:signal transduction histidine kinase